MEDCSSLSNFNSSTSFRPSRTFRICHDEALAGCGEDSKFVRFERWVASLFRDKFIQLQKSLIREFLAEPVEIEWGGRSLPRELMTNHMKSHRLVGPSNNIRIKHIDLVVRSF
jgi:hypothetical protein